MSFLVIFQKFPQATVILKHMISEALSMEHATGEAALLPVVKPGILESEQLNCCPSLIFEIGQLEKVIGKLVKDHTLQSN